MFAEMEFSFSKYQGTGNDFILIDNRKGFFPKGVKAVQSLCDRKFGIGADGLILIEDHPTLDYKMIYFNSDGSQSLCGNGSRCGFSFAQALGIVKQSARFETTDGVHDIKSEDGLIHFSFYDTQTGISSIKDDWHLNTGSPHCIRFVKDTDQVDVLSEGRKIRNLPSYSSQNGTNVNFAQLLTDSVKMRTYERGVENETLSCGTGAVAVALMSSQFGLKSPVKLETTGGDLHIYFEQNDETFSDIWLAGPAEKVFDGIVTI